MVNNQEETYSDKLKKNIEKTLEKQKVKPSSIKSVTWDDIFLEPDIKSELEFITDYLADPSAFGSEMAFTNLIFYGLKGTGKTLASLLIANEINRKYGQDNEGRVYVIETLPQKGGEELIRKVYEKARKNAPSIVLIPEADRYCTKKSELADIGDKRIVDQLKIELDGPIENTGVVTIVDTNDVESFEDALRRPGRFDKEVRFKAPSQEGRRKIIDIHMEKNHIYSLGKALCDYLAQESYGFTGGDIKGVLKEAFRNSHRRVVGPLKLKHGEKWAKSEKWKEIKNKGIVLQKSDLESAIDCTYPSALRGQFYMKPEKRFTELGGYEGIKDALKLLVVHPIKNPEVFMKYKRKPSAGILLYGPQRTGKTELAKACAKETGANLLVVRGPQIYNELFGKSEEFIRNLKKMAVEAAPCILLLDEGESVLMKRGSRYSSITDSITGQFLSEFSSIPEGLYLMITTNRPDLIDPAALDSGRIGKHIYVGYPDCQERKAILELYLSSLPIKNIDYDSLVKQTKGFNGAHIEHLFYNLTDHLIMAEVLGQEAKISPEIISQMIPSKPVIDNNYWQEMKEKFGDYRPDSKLIGMMREK